MKETESTAGRISMPSWMGIKWLLYLDNLEIDFLSSRIKQSDKKHIIEWVETHEEALIEIRQKENGEFEIPFLGYSWGVTIW